MFDPCRSTSAPNASRSPPAASRTRSSSGTGSFTCRTLHGGFAGGLGLGDVRVVLGEVQPAQRERVRGRLDRDRDRDGLGIAGAEVLAGLEIGVGGRNGRLGDGAGS